MPSSAVSNLLFVSYLILRIEHCTRNLRYQETFCVCVCACVCVCVCVCVCLQQDLYNEDTQSVSQSYTHTHLHTYPHKHTFTTPCLPWLSNLSDGILHTTRKTHTHTHTHQHTHTHTPAHTHTHTPTHTHTHTHTEACNRILGVLLPDCLTAWQSLCGLEARRKKCTSKVLLLNPLVPRVRKIANPQTSFNFRDQWVKSRAGHLRYFWVF